MPKEMISMGSLFDDLKQGLEEAIEYEKGQGKALCADIRHSANEINLQLNKTRMETSYE